MKNFLTGKQGMAEDFSTTEGLREAAAAIDATKGWMDKHKEVIAAVDFDGTLCENEWPKIGKANSELIQYLIKVRETGIKVILWTCRDGKLLEEAVEWCRERGLEFDAVNENLPEVVEAYGEDPRKITATVYIDDRAADVRHYKLPFREGDAEVKYETILDEVRPEELEGISEEVDKMMARIKLIFVIILGMAAGVWLHHQWQAMQHPNMPEHPAPEVYEMPAAQSGKPVVSIMQCWKEEDAARQEETAEEIQEEIWCDSLELLAMCVEAEAGSQDMTGKRMVVDVILNRVDDPGWPDTIEGVISQKYQFASYWNGAIGRAVPSEETFEAVRTELEERGWPGLYYFTAEGWSGYGTPWKKVGDHYFSTK